MGWMGLVEEWSVVEFINTCGRKYQKHTYFGVLLLVKLANMGKRAQKKLNS